MTIYGDITPRTAAYAARDLLARGIPYLCIEKFGQTKPLPSRSTKVAKFRRYNALAITPKTLTEGVTPAANTLTNTDYTATLVQYGDRLQITDIIEDTHEDPVLQESTEILGEQAAQMIENTRWSVLVGGTNVRYAGGVASRLAVATKLTLADQRMVTRALKNQNARKITNVVRSTPSWGTEQVAPSFIALCHSDLESDIRDMVGFVPCEKYGTITPYENEIGKVEDVRYLCSTIFGPFLAAGPTVVGTPGFTSNGGTNNDVYPVLYIGRDAYGIVPLKGKHAIVPMVVNPKPSDSDPMGQRGHVAWKTLTATVILNDLWMSRLEVLVTQA